MRVIFKNSSIEKKIENIQFTDNMVVLIRENGEHIGVTSESISAILE